MSKQATPRNVSIVARFASFDLPPVRDVVLLGRKAAIGPRAFHDALERLLPGVYELVPVEHEVVEAMLVRRDKLRALKVEELLEVLLPQASGLMDADGSVHATLEVEVAIKMELSR